MRKILQYAILLVLAIVSFSACKSNEQKAAALIKDYMFKNLFDYESYEPIETSIDSAYNQPMMNSQILALAFDSVEKEKEAEEHHKEYEDASRTRDIWSGGWFSYSTREYNKARKKAIELIASIEGTRASVRNLKQIKSMADTLSSGFIGWSAIHSFRCNTQGGNKTIGNYLFIFDKSLKTILNVFDAHDEDLVAAIDKIGTAQANKLLATVREHYLPSEVATAAPAAAAPQTKLVRKKRYINWSNVILIGIIIAIIAYIIINDAV